MPAIPPVCQSIADSIAAKERKIEVLTKSISEPDTDGRFPSSTKKAAIGAEIRQLGEEIRDLDTKLQICVRDNRPLPDPGTKPTLAIRAIEVVQVLQRPGNSVRLVRSKLTAVRVFVESGVSNGFDAGAGENRWPGVVGELRAVDPTTGTTIAGPLSPVSGAIVARPPDEIDRNLATHSLNFVMPLVAATSSSLRLDARVFVSGHRTDAGGWTASGSTTVATVPRAQQEITPILIATPFEGDATGPTLPLFITTLLAGALPRMPLPRFQVHPPIRWVWPGPLGDRLTWSGLLAQIMTAIIITGTRQGGIRAGFVTLPASTSVLGVGSPRAAFVGPAFVSSPLPVTLAHEMAHAHGVWHSRCLGIETEVDESVPGRTNAVGMDVATGSVLFEGSPELMGSSSCPGGPRWPSTVTYDRIFDTGPI